MNHLKEKYIGTRKFYLYALGIAIPMIVQSLITNFVSMIDNIMVGQVGTLPMSGVSIVNQFIFVFNITVFGACSGASIFGTQFFGKKDYEGQKQTFRFRLILVAIIIFSGIFILQFFGDVLIRLFLSSDESLEKIADTLCFGKDYLNIIICSLIPFGTGQAYCSAVRECGETKIPMYGSMAAIGVNLILDYGLIFGKFGMPEMGVRGAALATLLAKCVEAMVVVIWAHTHTQNNRYIIGCYRGFFCIPGNLVRRIIFKSLPLLLNEFLWALGMAVVSQCYSVKGIDVVAARNIASTLTNLFTVVYVQFGSAIGITVGMRLGGGLFKEARDASNKLTVFSLLITVLMVICLIPIGMFFPQAYQTTDSIKALATYFIIVQAIAMPLSCFTNSCYFTLRSGGQIAVTFLFDSGFTWVILIPLAFVLTHFTGFDIHVILIMISCADILKCTFGYLMLRSDIWVKNIVN